MLDHSKPEFAPESETLKDSGSSSQKMASSWKSPLSLQNSRDFPASFQAKPFIQYDTATQQLLRKECESGRVNNWEGLQIKKLCYKKEMRVRRARGDLYANIGFL